MPKSNSSKSFNILIALVAVLAIASAVLFAWTTYEENVQAAKKQMEHEAVVKAAKEKVRREKLKEWPNPAPPALPVLDPLPLNMPPIPPATVVKDGQTFFDPSVRAKYLVVNHPDRDIRRLDEMVERKAAFASMMTNLPKTTVAFFRTTDHALAIQSYPDAIADANGRVPQFGFNAQRLIEMNNEREMKIILSFVYHEWRHFEQYQEATGRGDLEEIGTFTKDAPGEYTPNECALFWQHELDAWRDTCYFAIQIGIVDHFQRICPWVGDEPLFKQAYFNYDPAHTVTPNSDECVPTNARLAGHPHPEAFE